MDRVRRTIRFLSLGCDLEASGVSPDPFTLNLEWIMGICYGLDNSHPCGQTACNIPQSGFSDHHRAHETFSGAPSFILGNS